MKPLAIALAAIVSSVVSSVAVPGARADAPAAPPPDPAARRAGESNLETLERRRGLTGGIMVGPSFTIGTGVGNGGAVAVRLGQVATPSWVLTFELNGSAQLRRTGSGADADTYTNSIASFLVGGQYWVGPSLWVRGAGGVGVYTCTKLCGGMAGSERRTGPAAAVGVGVDLARFKGLVLSIELSSINQLNRNGLLSTNGMALGLTFD